MYPDKCQCDAETAHHQNQRIIVANQITHFIGFPILACFIHSFLFLIGYYYSNITVFCRISVKQRHTRFQKTDKLPMIISTNGCVQVTVKFCFRFRPEYLLCRQSRKFRSCFVLHGNTFCFDEPARTTNRRQNQQKGQGGMMLFEPFFYTFVIGRIPQINRVLLELL